MKLTLVVCGFLLGLILSPIDGRLKYAEVVPDNAFQKLSDSNLSLDVPESPLRETTSSQGKGAEPPDPPTDVGVLPLNCFPLADRLHKYDWARFFLRHLAVASRTDGFQNEASVSKEDSSNGQVDSSSMAGLVTRKRSDFNREISADLYAQYPSSCACQTKYELLDLGYTHFPRYIVNAICQNRSSSSRKCWRGSSCKEIPYKVRVLTKRTDGESSEQDHHSTLLPEPLRDYWRFKTVTIAAACQCSI
uniref:Spaetzle domain-containing protein n=1 Tax=Anopheles epiroticus TaxID=199890 RepID=A0A182PUB2_9DIPT